MNKLTSEIQSVELQMGKASKRLKNSLAQQRDALAAQYEKAGADYAQMVSQMDELMSSLSIH